jgi:pimeloyl-ACP methyl ester carboxylesterase
MSTYVLIPGAGGEAWYWHRAVPLLEARGHEAIAVDLPAADDSCGWPEYADAVVNAIGDRQDLILVAQSLGGFTAPLVCERVPVAMLVLLNAMIPRPGETGGEWWSNTVQGAAQREYLARIGVSADQANDDRVLYFHDVPADVVDEAYRRGEPQQSWMPMTQPWPLDAWPDVPTRVVAGRDDRLFPAEFQQRVARERLGIDADLLDGGHLLALSEPEALVERIESNRAELAERHGPPIVNHHLRWLAPVRPSQRNPT